MCSAEPWRSLFSESGLIGVGNVEESIGILSLLVDFAHEGVSLQEISSVDEEIKGTSFWKLDSLSDDVVEVISREIIWDEIPNRIKDRL